ncbi:hypothetical protein B0H14DRAFT_3520609 [Mycena olivaceomarginata]|nr:hypothetical protein B0H14DRAFT_3520609 [Mycena olivaceomarginata]
MKLVFTGCPGLPRVGLRAQHPDQRHSTNLRLRRICVAHNDGDAAAPARKPPVCDIRPTPAGRSLFLFVHSRHTARPPLNGLSTHKEKPRGTHQFRNERHRRRAVLTHKERQAMNASTRCTNFGDQSVSPLLLFFPLSQMAQSNPKPTSYADRAAVTSDRVTRAANEHRVSHCPTPPPLPLLAPAAAAAPLAVVSELPPVADAPTTGAPNSVTMASPSTAVPAVPVSTAMAAPSPAPTLVPVSAAVVAALTHISAPTPAAAAKPPVVAKTAAPASKATTSSAAKANAAPTLQAPPPRRTTALPAAKTTATADVPTTALAPQPAARTPPASAAAQNAAQHPAASALTTPSNGVTAPTASSTPRGRAHSPGPDFPPVSASHDASPKSHAQKRKENKAKGKAKAPRAPAPTQGWISPTPSPTQSDDEDFLDEGCTSYDLDADLNRALKMSVGQTTDMDTGASSSRRAATRAIVNGPPVSPKRPRTDSAARETPGSSPKRQHEPRPRINRRPPTFDTADGNPPRGSFVPFNELLTRVIYGMSTRTLYRNHPARQLSQWDEVPQPKVAATISGGNGDRIQTVELVRTSIADRFNVPRASLLIGTPGLAENNGPDPIAWLIAGISADQAKTLIDMGCLCSDTITIFFHEYHPPISGFMGTWQGFTMAESDAELAHRIIVDAVLADPAITRFVRAHRDSFPADMIADECLELFGNHIITLPINLLSPRGPFVAWNVYIKSPTNDEEPHLHPPLHCNICLSVDHPTNLCLLPSIPGWLGPTPETIGALLDATREVLNPRAKKSGSRPRDDKSKGKGKGKGP